MALHRDKDEEICFICGRVLQDFFVILTETVTPYLGISLPKKIGHVIGDKFIVIVSNNDKICRRCLCLFEKLDEFESNVITTKNKVLKLLEHKYGVKSDSNISERVLISEDQDILEDFPLKQCPPCDIFNSEEHDSSECVYPVENINKSCDILSLKDKVQPVNFVYPKTETGKIIKEIQNNFIDNAIKTRKKGDFKSEKLNIPSLETELPEFKMSNNKETENMKLIEVENIKQLQLKIINNEIVKTKSNSVEVPFDMSMKYESTANKEEDTELLISSQVEETSITCTKCKTIINKSESEFHNCRKEIYLCNICDIPFRKPNSLKRHTQIHKRNSGKVVCNICGQECYDQLQFLYHRKNIHFVLKNIHSCAVCNSAFDSEKELKSHSLLYHPYNKNLVCKICGTQFKRQIQYENHMQYFHGSKNCRVCGKHIEDGVKLRQHEHRHARLDLKKQVCDICGRIFKTPSGLRVHKVSHTGNYKFFCEYCGRGFMSSVIMEEHKGIHTKEEKYMCDICGQKFIHNSTLHLHKQWHKDPFPFPCHVCKRKFKYRSERSNHTRKEHTGEHPYKCSYCPSEFFKSAYLKRHIISHTKKYPYNCDTCSKGFDQRRSFARHLARVHNDKSLINISPRKCQYKVILRPDDNELQKNLEHS